MGRSISSTAVSTVLVTRDDITNQDRFISFVEEIESGFQPLRSSNGIKYNPATQTLTVPNISGNIETASKLANPVNISLGGDLTGSVSFDGSSDVTLTATVDIDSVELGADTTGNYIQKAFTSGKGITGFAQGEAAEFEVISSATELNTPDTIVYRDATGSFSAGTLTLSGDVTVGGGDIVLQGSTGRIQGIDVVTDPTDATNKEYVDTAILEAVPPSTDTSISDLTETQVYQYDASVYRSAKLVVQASHSTEGFETLEVLVLHDGTTAFSTEYADIFTGTSPLIELRANFNSGFVDILATPNNSNTDIKVVSLRLIEL